MHCRHPSGDATFGGLGPADDSGGKRGYGVLGLGGLPSATPLVTGLYPGDLPG